MKAKDDEIRRRLEAVYQWQKDRVPRHRPDPLDLLAKHSTTDLQDLLDDKAELVERNEKLVEILEGAMSAATMGKGQEWYDQAQAVLKPTWTKEKLDIVERKAKELQKSLGVEDDDEQGIPHDRRGWVPK